ncbi:probable Na(+)/H(+) antiporter nhx-9 [Anabrus simplex]|uniref:probable Na(+)/H(+) antiporter nhx-9 n=1 Tax=Anabrus simplex TaxID=316456 RepID=UPI0035A35024
MAGCTGLVVLMSLLGPALSFNETEKLSVQPVHHGIHVANWRWDELGLFFTFTAFIVVAGLAKVAFHHAHWISTLIPESCLMIAVGVSVGGIIFLCGAQIPENTDDRVFPHTDVREFAFPMFTPRLFFLILLPPVILESAYSLHDRSFADNLGSVLLFAVVGTLWNTFSIGFILYGLSELGTVGAIPVDEERSYSLTLIDAMVFSSLISGVDPVAVLAIFQEVGVNKDLYYLVFGESLFNDAVTVVLYTTMVTFCEMPHIPNEQYLLATLAFFTVSLGGAAVGVVFGLISALVTRTTNDCRVVEPLAVLGIAYLSYLTAELFHFSGIISIIICGLVQAHYALNNISSKSYTTVKYFTKMLSSTCDAIIFLFLGMELVSDRHVWHTGFVLWTLLLCLLCRFIGVLVLTAIANVYRVKKIDFQEQFIMGYGGLRGAVAFSLAVMLDSHLIPRQIFITTTLIVILFTVFIQGATIKPLVHLLHIRLSKTGHKTLNEELNDSIIGNLMAGIEEVTGVRGDFYIQRKFEHFDDLYLKKLFMRESSINNFTKLYEKLLLTDHYAHLYGPVTLVEDKKTDILHITEPTPKSPASPSERSSLRVSLLFPGVELRHPLTVPSSPHSDTTPSTETLRRALRDNPYHKLHERYNPNLIDDDCQELNEHLERRLLRARHITHIAAINNRMSAMSDPAPSPRLGEEFDWPKRQIQSQLEGYFPEDLEGIDALLERAGKRRKASTAGSTGGDSLQVPRSPVPSTVLNISEPPRRLSCSQHEPTLGYIKESEDDVFFPPVVSESSL